MQISKYLRAASVLPIVAMLGLAQPASAQEEPRPGGSVSFAIEGGPDTLDCHAGATVTVLYFIAPHYSNLVKFSAEDYPTIVGDVAESWEVAEDGMGVTFALRPDMLFHDGTTLDAEDVAASFERLRNPPQGIVSARQSMFSNIDMIEVVDPLTIRFTMKEPDAALLDMFANPWNCIYSAEKLAEDPNYPATEVMGSGPFKFVDYTPGASWKGERFEDYFREGLPYLDSFEVVQVDGAGLVTALAGSQVDANFRMVPPPAQERIRSVRGDELVFPATESGTVVMATLNHGHEPFADERVRRALNIAIDRDGGLPAMKQQTILSYISGAMRGEHKFGLPRERLADYPGFSGDIEERREEARNLLREAGHENLRFSLLNRNIRTPYEPVGIFLIDQWRRIGVNVEMQLAETGEYFTRLRQGQYEAAVDYNAASGDDPSEILLKYLPSSGSNFSHAEMPELEELYRQQYGELDEDKRRELVQAFEDIVYSANYNLHLFRGERAVAYPVTLRGWHITPSYHVGNDLAEVWWSEEE